MSTDQAPALKRRAYKDQVFCWIENGETDKVKKFIEMYENHAKSFVTVNSWSLAMFACRYGNLELLQFLLQKKFVQEGQFQYTLVHAACFGNELEILKYLVDTLRKDPVPLNDQQPPLKICFRSENISLAEFLISRGSYYQYGSFCHNVRAEPFLAQLSPPPVPPVQVIKYKTIQKTSKGELLEIDIPNSLVFMHSSIQKESSMLQFLRFARVRNFAYAKRLSEQQKPLPISDDRKKENFSYLLKCVFENPEQHGDPDSPHFKVLEFLVGKKDPLEFTNSASQQIQNISNMQSQVLAPLPIN